MDSMAGATSEPQVQVRFTTKLEARFRVTEAPIQLPTRLTRHGLSEVINHLLNAEKPVAFDFVTEDGSLLRGSESSAGNSPTDVCVEGREGERGAHDDALCEARECAEARG